MEDRPARSKAPAKETEQKAYPALYILLSAPEAVLEQAVQDSPDAEGRLNDVRREFADCGWGRCERWCARTGEGLPFVLKVLRSIVSMLGWSVNSLLSTFIVAGLSQE
jgi:hypothetical protein